MNSSYRYFENLKNDSRSTKEIIQLACHEDDEEAYWDYVWILRARGSNEEFLAAAQLCKSPSPRERTLGVDILGMTSISPIHFRQQCSDILLKLLSSETNSKVLASIGFAFGHLNDARGILPLVKLKNHPDVNVRMGVVFGLSCQNNELAIQALIDLSSDEDQEIRNWATFDLGSQIETDTPEIRNALLARVMTEIGEDDTIAEIRGEALLGLAVRKDERVIHPLIAELESNCVGRLPVEAAAAIGDVRLYPVLMHLQEWWEMDTQLLQDAISSCNTNPNLM